LGKAQVEIEQAKSHKKHYEMKLKEQEKKIHDLRKKVDIYKAEIEVKKKHSLFNKYVNFNFKHVLE